MRLKEPPLTDSPRKPIAMPTPLDETPLIVARDVAMSFGADSLAISGISTTINAGEFVSIVGPSGCGKSTFLRLVAGLRSATSGSLLIDDLHPTDSPLRRAFVFQDPSLLPWRTVEANVRLPFELGHHRDSTDAKTRVAQTLRLVGLAEADALKRPRELSGGMRMRVSLARALVTDPQIMLLDEPFAALDDILRQQLNEELQRIWFAKRWTGLFVTHNVSEAVFLSQRVLVMSRRPGTFLADIAVPFGFPRSPNLRAEPEFARLTGEISVQLRRAAGVMS